MIDENITSSSDKIIEGTYESKELSVLGLVYAGKIKCTGTLIAPRTVLTAAHCIYVQSNQMLTLPENVVVVDDQRWVDFANIVDYAIHPNWTGESHQEALFGGNDLALIYLDHTFDVPTIALDQQEITQRIGQEGIIVGFGKTDADNVSSAGIKHSAQMVLKRVTGANQSLMELESTNELYRGACHGDSGGPFIMSTNEQRTLVGVTSFGSTDCDSSSKYVSVSSHFSWLSDNLIERSFAQRSFDFGETEPTIPVESCYELLACYGRCYQVDQCLQACSDRATDEQVEAADALLSCNEMHQCQGSSRCLSDYCEYEALNCDASLL